MTEPIQQAQPFQQQKVKVKVPPKASTFNLPSFLLQPLQLKQPDSITKIRISVRLSEWSY